MKRPPEMKRLLKWISIDGSLMDFTGEGKIDPFGHNQILSSSFSEQG